MTFRGRVALVTGAGSGIGRLAAQRLAAQGAQVAALDLDADGLEVTRRYSPNVSTHVVDVTDAAALGDCVAHVAAASGPVDRLVHAAGICLPGPLVEQPAVDIERVMTVNYLGTVHAVKAVVDGMVERSRGDIVLLASMAGWVPSYRLGAYDASKFAVVAFGEVLAHELEGRGVRTVVVCPPPVDTPMLDGIRAADPRAIGDQPSIRAAEVLDAAETALERGEVFAFPGRGTRAAIRVRRHAPDVLWRRLARIERGPASQPRHGAPPA